MNDRNLQVTKTLEVPGTTERSAKVTTSASSPEKILQTGLAFWASKTLLTAVGMGVFTERAQTGPQHFDELSGFRDARVEHLVGPDSMVIAFK